MQVSVKDAANANQSLVIADTFTAGSGRNIRSITTLDSLFTDDFGSAAVDLTKWDVLDGGLGANVNLGAGVLTQAAIGSGTIGMTDVVSNSGLAVSMNTTSGAERLYLSKQVFAGKEDILVILSKSQALAANSIFVGLVEVDPTTLVPLLNPNLAGDFTNRGGVEFGVSAVTTAYHCEAIGDSSGVVASGVTGVASAWTVAQECTIEIDSRDIIASTSLVDAVAGKVAGASRVSTQCPNDKKVYKLAMRFKNPSAPGSNTTVTIQRILVSDNYEQRVQVSTAEGDNIPSKALAVNLVGSGLGVAAPSMSVNLIPTATSGPQTVHKLNAAATTNATSVKVTTGTLVGGLLRNNSAGTKWFKLFLKASAPTVGTDVPVLTLGIPAGGTIALADVFGAGGYHMATGIAYAITGAYTDLDTTNLVAGDVEVNLIYT